MDATLDWSPGLSAVKHNVYLGTDINDVSQASVDDPRGVLVSPNQDEATYLPVELESNTTYYWRVDDVNDAHPDSPLMGKVWTFTTGDFVVIDDFEDYNDENNLVFDTWIDGIGNESNGSFTGNAGPPYMETNVVHGGSQSMPVTYGYQGAPMSEATRTLPAAVDASRFAQIRMWIIASRTSNTNQPMYITLNGTNKLTNDVNVTAATEWTEVAYDLGGVTSITSVTIGTGAGLGIVLVDDLRLHVAAPVE